jgi:hypothetical protein
MDSQAALKFINDVFSRNGQPPLTELEEKVFLGSWEKQEYKEIAGKTGYVDITLREVGAALWQKIKTALSVNTKINKKNFRKTIEYYYNNHTSVSSSLIIPNNIKKQPNDNYSNNQNPFVPLDIKVDTPEKFFGREEEIWSIFHELNNCSAVEVIGVEGIGKSSLLWAICEDSKNLNLLNREGIFIDLNMITNANEFYQTLFDEIGINIDINSPHKFKRELTNQKLLLGLDNIGKLMYEGFTRGFREQLRGFVEHPKKPLKLVVATVEPLKKLFNDGKNARSVSPLEGIFQQVNIKPWNETTIRNFIAKRLEPTTINFTETDIQELIEESGGHPKKLTQLCYNLYKKYS